MSDNSVTVKRKIWMRIGAVALAAAVAIGGSAVGAGSSYAAAQTGVSDRSEKAVQWAIATAKDNKHGYSMVSSRRWGNPDYDCGTFVTSAFRAAGFTLNGFACVGNNMVRIYQAEGFRWIPASEIGFSKNYIAPASLQRGDILVDKDRHAEIYIGNNQDVGAHRDYDGVAGDSSGREVSVSGYYYNVAGVVWDGVLRYVGTNQTSNNSKPAGVVKTKIAKVTAKSRTYNGSVITPVLTVTDKNGNAVPAGSYSVKYSGDRTNAGSFIVKVTGKGNYSGSASCYAKIKPKSAAKAVVASISARNYTGAMIKPKPSVKLNGKKLVKNQDYSYKWTNSGTKGTVNVVFKNNYKGTLTKTFKINKMTLKSFSPKLGATKFVYDGSAAQPAVIAGKLKKNTDYTVSYKNNVNAGKASATIQAKGMVSGKKTLKFTIQKHSLSGDAASISVDDVTYNGEAQMPSIHFSNPATTVVTDFRNNRDAGTGSVTIKGTNNYSGTVKKTFQILAVSLSDPAVKITGIKNQKYTGAAADFSNVAVAYTCAGADGSSKTLRAVLGRDYTLSAPHSDRVGKHTVTLTGKGNYQGTFKKSYKILPAKVTGLKLRRNGRGVITVSYPEVPGGVYYQIKYKKSGSSWKTVKTKLVSKNIRKLAAGKYSVQVRAYKSGACGKWSAVKKITVK